MSNGVSIKDFDPRPAVFYWLKPGDRNIDHKNPVKSAIKQVVWEPDNVYVKPLLKNLVKSLGGEEALRAKLKNTLWHTCMRHCYYYMQLYLF